MANKYELYTHEIISQRYLASEKNYVNTTCHPMASKPELYIHEIISQRYLASET
jgi:hypothetical protein